jgi:2-dehydro-3-deoxy-D-arabinonate dehydratase
MSALLYKTSNGPVVRVDGHAYSVAAVDWDTLLNIQGLAEYLEAQTTHENRIRMPTSLEAPIGSQEIWGAGVTYYTSRTARMQESQAAGGREFYNRVYDAARPELFFKAIASRVAAPGNAMRLRRDSNWIVPEPELTLVINRDGAIIGYTIANDLTCRDIEGENPLYLPQAKIWDGSASIGPGLLIQNSPLSPETIIRLEILRGGNPVYTNETELAKLKRKPQELVAYLTREASFPSGCFLMTGTGIVPEEDVSLQPGDEVRITIEPIGTLINGTE